MDMSEIFLPSSPATIAGSPDSEMYDWYIVEDESDGIPAAEEDGDDDLKEAIALSLESPTEGEGDDELRKAIAMSLESPAGELGVQCQYPDPCVCGGLHTPEAPTMSLPTAPSARVDTRLHSASVHTLPIHAAAHCNRFIKSNYAFEDSLFSSKILPNGWLGPSVGRIQTCRHAMTTLSLKGTPVYSGEAIMYYEIFQFDRESRDRGDGHCMLGPNYAFFLSTFSTSYKRAAQTLMRICRRRKPDIAWNEIQMERLVKRCAVTGDAEPAMEEVVRRTGNGAKGSSMWDNLPCSVRAFLGGRNAAWKV